MLSLFFFWLFFKHLRSFFFIFNEANEQSLSGFSLCGSVYATAASKVPVAVLLRAAYG